MSSHLSAPHTTHLTTRTTNAASQRCGPKKQPSAAVTFSIKHLARRTAQRKRYLLNRDGTPLTSNATVRQRERCRAVDSTSSHFAPCNSHLARRRTSAPKNGRWGVLKNDSPQATPEAGAQQRVSGGDAIVSILRSYYPAVSGGFSEHSAL